MRRTRLILGFIAGGIILLSAFAHSVLGWKQISAALGSTQTPADLVQTLAFGWHFAGVAMLGFGTIVVLTFVRFGRDQGTSLAPATIIALTYLAFGTWATVASRFDPFFLTFLVPGAMLLAASWRKTSDPIWDV